MIDRDNADKRARDVPAFSKSDEGLAWMANWCDRCTVDAPYRSGISPLGCPLIEIALTGRTPAEWLEQPPDHYPDDAYHCVEFKPRGGGGEPRPRPTPPGQGELLPRESYTGVRMYEQQRDREAVSP